MPSSITLKAEGLITSPNPLSKPAGAMDVATNVVIKRDNVVESRRGFRLYDETYTGISKQLKTYQERIIRHVGSNLSFDTGILDSSNRAIFNDFSGSYIEAQSGLKIKSVEASGNFYFTSNNGIQKISAALASDLSTDSGYITQSGGVKALDIQSRISTSPGQISGFFTQDATVAYRAVWGTNDANNNLILGTPSQRTEIYNPLINMVLMDYQRLLGALDDLGSGVTTDSNLSGSLIDNNNYELQATGLRLTSNSTATSIFNNLNTLVTKMDTDIRIADIASTAPLQISTTAGDASIVSNILSLKFTADPTSYLSVGSNVYLTGFTDFGSKVITNPDRTTPGYKIASITGAAGSPADTITINLNIPLTAGATAPTYTNGNVTKSSPVITGNNYRSITIPIAPQITPTDQDLVNLQSYISSIFTKLQNEPAGIIGTTISGLYVVPLSITSSSNVILDITIPRSINANYFLQLYRSSQSIATGVTVLSSLIPSDEMQQVYEAYPTAAQIAAGVITVTDNVADSFRGADLYTNPDSGEGILQANDVPPYCLDIARYKNAIFYANTRTKYRLSLSLLGISNMITDYNNNITPKVVITDGTSTNTFKFVTGVQQITTIACNGASTLVSSTNPGSYLTFYNAKSQSEFYVWYKCGTSTDPAPAGMIGLQVNVGTSDSNSTVAQKTCNTINRQVLDFSATVSSNTVTMTNVNTGYTTNPSAGTSGFTVTVATSGGGELLSAGQIVLSNQVSAGKAVDETARSLVKIINQTSTGAVYAYYLSGAGDTPGKITLESRILSNSAFYVLGNDSNTGSSFNPSLIPTNTISAISVANPSIITTATAHGLLNGDSILTVGSNSTPSIDGLYPITFISTTQFSIPVSVTGSGSAGSIIKLANSAAGTNEVKPQRIYFSKILEPEAVPIVNYMDIGSENKAILRIFPIRDSLFVFKEDGLYRVSGEQPPYNIALFDSSYLLIAPDSLDVANNIIYAWTEQGIQTVSESGVDIISRNIDVDILKIGSANYPNFATATWGIGYESDNAYLFFTVSETTDIVPTICYRYSYLTRSWSTWTKTNTCGVVNPADLKLYLGAGDVFNIEQERKTFSRLDYADREVVSSLSSGNYLNGGLQMKLGSILGINIGDVVTQDQLVDPYIYNNLLLKLDSDLGIQVNNFTSTLLSVPGDDLRKKLVDSIIGLAPKLDSCTNLTFKTYTSSIASTSGTITANSIATNTIIATASAHNLLTNRWITISGTNSTPVIDGNYQVTVIDSTHFSIVANVISNGTSGTFQTLDSDFRDIQACYNILINLLNTDSGTGYKNYAPSNITTTQEAIITGVNLNTNIITLNLMLPFVVGPLTIFNAIPTTFTYSPNTLDAVQGFKNFNPQMYGDPLGLKHLREATLMFETQAFTTATLSFATDLVPVFFDINFNGEGNGIFGMQSFGNNYFGGAGNSVPFRTYIPRDYQRCKYILVKYSHRTAREKWSILGVTITGEMSQSTKGYR